MIFMKINCTSCKNNFENGDYVISNIDFEDVGKEINGKIIEDYEGIFSEMYHPGTCYRNSFSTRIQCYGEIFTDFIFYENKLYEPRCLDLLNTHELSTELFDGGITRITGNLEGLLQMKPAFSARMTLGEYLKKFLRIKL